MTFISKLAELVILPRILLVLLGIIGILLIRKSPETGRSMVLGSLLGLLVCGLLPVGETMVRPLENRFERPDSDMLATMHGAILLGGVVQGSIMKDRNVLALNGAAERLVEFDRLALRDPNLPLVISGGSGSLWDQQAEAPLIRDWLTSVGVPKHRILVESTSRNTWENAHASLSMLNEHLDLNVPRSLLIVTSAAHMPRAIGSFRQAASDLGYEQLEFFAWPVDYRSTPVTVLRIQRLGDGLSNLDQAFREWLALTAYFLFGRTAEWLPGPYGTAPTQS